eukprot:10145906-Ditylum_brightwellii.AAC.1
MANEAWALGPNSYLKEALRIVEDQMRRDGVQDIGKGKQPLPRVDYRPELDETRMDMQAETLALS